MDRRNFLKATTTVGVLSAMPTVAHTVTAAPSTTASHSMLIVTRPWKATLSEERALLVATLNDDSARRML